MLEKIPLTIQVQGPYCKLPTKLFPVDLRPKCKEQIIKICIIEVVDLYIPCEQIVSPMREKPLGATVSFFE